MPRSHPVRALRRRRSGRLTSHEDQIVHWILRTLVRAGAAAIMGAKHGISDTVREAIGLPDPRMRASRGRSEADGEEDVATRRRRIRAILKTRLGEVEAGVPEPCMASQNAEIVRGMLGLTRAETAVLAFTTALDAEDALRESFLELGCRSLPQIARHIATVLQLRRPEVERALRRDGPLRSLPLVVLSRPDSYGEGPITLTDAMGELLLRPLGDDDLVRHFLQPVEPPTVALSDYPHVAEDIDLLTRYLKGALRRHSRGVNVLIHGPPGTGKTELVRAVAMHLGAELDQVTTVDGDSDALRSCARLESYAVCQRILRGRRGALLLFDEIEDAFPTGGDGFLGLGPKLTTRKGWTNQLLEQNPTPALWVSNAIDQMDPAFIRRFDFVMELPQPPRSVRRRVIDRHLGDLPISEEARQRLAEQEDLSPGHVQQAARVLHLTRPKREKTAEADLVRLVDANLRAFTGKAPKRTRKDELDYDLSLLNMSTDAQALLDGLGRTGRGTMCFHGPPGTGKTALARHLAKQLDVPLHTHRASDLLSMWVGGTEKAMARMFERAKADEAVLLLDEADSFLTDRRGASQSWERTQVNEMLTQMEDFEGIFICSTNLMDHLDHAAMRRFALKIRFDYMTPKQAAVLFNRTLSELNPGEFPPGCQLIDELHGAPNATPGDFAAVVRRMKMLGERPDLEGLVHAVGQECGINHGRARKVGFSR